MSENKLKDIQNSNSFSIAVLRTLYLSVVVLTISGNIYLVSNGYLNWSICLLIAASTVMAILIILIFRNQKNTEKFKQHGNNVKEAQRIIFEVENKVFPFLRKRNTSKLENYSLNKDEGKPLNWLICCFVFWIFFTTDTYTKFDFTDLVKLISLIFMSLLQMLVLSYAISKMVIVLFIKTKGD